MDLDDKLKEYGFLNFTMNDLDQINFGNVNYTISYAMRFNSWEEMFEITRDMYIESYILDVEGNMTDQGYGDGILDIVITKKKINSKIHDLF